MQFLALMKKLEVKSLQSGDKEAQLLLRFQIPDDSLIDGLNRKMRADRFVNVTIEEGE